MGRTSRDMERGKTSNAERPTSNVELGGEKALVGGFDFVAGNDEGDFGNRVVFAEEFARGLDGDLGGVGDRVAVGAAADGGERDGADVILDGDTQRVAVA